MTNAISKPVTCGLSLAVTVSLLYLACALVVAAYSFVAGVLFGLVQRWIAG